MVLKIAVVGYGMMGVWHSQALKDRKDVQLDTLVGRRADAAKAFAQDWGYRRATTELAEALADPAIDAVILATPSELHETQAIACLEADKHVLVEIPIAMSLEGAGRVVAAAQRGGRICAVCHPMRFRKEREALRARIAAGEETVRHIAGRFFISRLTNVGATGYTRSWTDNILWHHFCHFVDLGCFLFDYADPVRSQSYLGQPHAVTGVPMEAIVQFETAADQSFLVHGSYHAAYRLYDKLIVTDRDTYLFYILESTLKTRDGVVRMEDEATNCARVTHDFVEAVLESRAPVTPAETVMPAMRILQAAQDDWDLRYGARDLPGRAL